MLTAAAIAFAIYIAAVLRVSQSFAVAILHYLPAALFLLIAFIVAFSISHELPLFLGITGVVLTFVAALVQQIKLRLHAKYFDHNAFYHLIQAVALLLLFLSAWRLPQPHVI